MGAGRARRIASSSASSHRRATVQSECSAIAGHEGLLTQGRVIYRDMDSFVAPGVWFLLAGVFALSLVVYPVLSWIDGHPYPFTPTFGLPCPTTIFTIGVLAFLTPPYPRSVFIVPVLWCLVGGTAAFSLGVTQDLALVVAAVAGMVLFIRSGVSTSR